MVSPYTYTPTLPIHMRTAPQTASNRGRKAKSGGPLVDRPIGFPALVNKQLEDISEETGRSVPDLVREAVDAKLNPPPVVQTTDLNNFRAPFLSSVPCGPWDKAIDSGTTLVVSQDIADELEAREGDVWVRASGESMCGAGILDGDVVLTRPYEGKIARRNEIVLVQVFEEGEEPVGTIKRFDGFEGQSVKLLDGDDNPFELPKNTEKVEIVARAIGRFGRL